MHELKGIPYVCSALLISTTGHAESVTSTGISMDGKLAATAALDGSVKVWDVVSGALVQNLEGPGASVEVTFTFLCSSQSCMLFLY